ncbi:hypothetical protein [Embleya sp. AB8]|uniref:hypothetical protein n=1 Tax=Embleya sp. AB8 TaxID=3156304 RepID=UPI003C78FBD2
MKPMPRRHLPEGWIDRWVFRTVESMEMSFSWWAGLPFPSAGVRVESVEVDADEVRVRAMSDAEGAGCPSRGAPSVRVHDRRVRRPAHATIAGRAVAVDPLVRRFVCAGRG